MKQYIRMSNQEAHFQVEVKKGCGIDWPVCSQKWLQDVSEVREEWNNFEDMYAKIKENELKKLRGTNSWLFPPYKGIKRCRLLAASLATEFRFS